MAQSNRAANSSSANHSKTAGHSTGEHSSGGSGFILVDGMQVPIAPGMTVATAALAAGIVNFRTSVRGEPRSPLCGMGICHECRITIDGVPHRRGCIVPASNGMVVVTGPEPSDYR